MSTRFITNRAWIRSATVKVAHLLSIISVATVLALGTGSAKVAEAAPRYMDDKSNSSYSTRTSPVLSGSIDSVNIGLPASAYWVSTGTTATVAAPTAVASPAFTLTKQPSGNWTKRMKLTFTNTAQTEDLLNFPVLVVLDSSRMSYAQTQDAGQDIRFVDADGMTILAHEIEKWDESGISYVWVKVPRIDGSSNTDHIWMYYGNPDASDGQDPATVWTESYRMVYHLAEDPNLTSGVIQDSTSNSFDAMNQGTTDAMGIIANAQEFDGISQYVNLGSGLAVLNVVSATTLSAWIRPDIVAGDGDILGLSITNGGTPIGSSRASIARRGNNVGIYARSVDNDSDFHDNQTTTNPLSADTWHYVAAVINYAGDAITIYVDGVPQAIGGTVAFISPTTPDTNSTSNAIGSNDDGSFPFFDGLIDEARVAATARSADWIAAQYKSTTDSFVTYGSQENVTTLPDPVTIGAPFTYTITITNTGQSAATNVVVTDTLPVGAHYVTGGSLIPSSDIVSWTVPSLASGDYDQVTFVVSTCRPSLVNASYRVVTSTEKVASPFGPPLTTLLTPPTVDADFDYDPPGIGVGSTVYFTDTSTTDGGPIADWMWDFGDNGRGSGPTVSHIYSNPGAYTVTLTVTDTCGFTDTKREMVRVSMFQEVDFASSTYAIGESGGTAIITVTLGAASSLTVSADYATFNGTATAPEDYVTASGTLTFTAGITTQTFTVSITPDLVSELDETVVLSLTGVTNAIVGTTHNPATLIILDDDARPTVDFSAPSYTVGESDGTAIIDVALSHPTSFPISVDYVTSSGTATAGDDYIAASGKLSFPPLAVTRIFTIPIIPDLINEPGETVVLSLTAATSATVGTTNNPATLTILDDESDFATIHGTVFLDINGNGVQDASETGIPDVLITLNAASLKALMTTTDLNGNYTFTTTMPGVHIITATGPSGYFPTTPNEVHVDVILGNAYQVNFGDALIGSSFAAIYGTVFNDDNGDGMYGGSDTGIPNVPVTLNTASLTAITTTTDLNGNYTFSTTVAGVHTIIETDLSGYYSSTPNERDVDVTLNNSYQVDFGDIEISTCAPDIHEEDDTANQARRFVVGTVQAHQFCDDATDWVKFTARAFTVYTITTSAWGRRADTILTLFDTDGQTELAATDDYTGTIDHSSVIVWEAPASGDYYVRITNQYALTGQRTDHDLWITTDYSGIVYLPLVVQVF